MVNSNKFDTMKAEELVEIKGGELGTLIALFAATYIIGSDLGRRGKK